MCLGQQPQAPEIKYQGPSQSDINRQEQALSQYQSQIAQQQQQFQTQLQEQIDAANAETAALRDQYAADLESEERAGAADVADATAAANAEQAAAYQVSATQSEPVQAQTTKAVTAKKKPKKNLKISTAGTASTAGSGLNIGV